MKSVLFLAREGKVDLGVIEKRLLYRAREAEDGCLEWMGTRCEAGHGHITIARYNMAVHRVAYELWVGEIPAGLVVHHRCRNRACMRPEHLEAMTQVENARLARGQVYVPVPHVPIQFSMQQRLEEQRRITDSGCWEWTGRLHPKGYAYIGTGGSLRHVHRVAYELWVGPIPDGLQLDHLCRNRCCFNPAHLEPVTREENLRRGIRRCGNMLKTHCKRGHPFDAENTILVPGPKGVGRRCRICYNATQAAFRLKNGMVPRVPKPPAPPKERVWATHCKRGHPFSVENTYLWVAATRIKRCCRACMRIADKKREPRDRKR